MFHWSLDWSLTSHPSGAKFNVQVSVTHRVTVTVVLLCAGLPNTSIVHNAKYFPNQYLSEQKKRNLSNKRLCVILGPKFEAAFKD